MTPARHHAEWLSLVESSGPFLSMPVLLRVFPQGLDLRDATRAAALRENYEDWLERGRPLAHVHTAWIRHVLESLLEWPADFIAEGQSIPAGLEASQPHFGETLRPDLVLRRASGSEGDSAPQLLVVTYPPTQDLEKPVSGKIWKASPATRMTELLHASGVPLGLVTNGEHWMIVYAPRGETSGFASWYADIWMQEPITLRAFHSLLCLRRFFGVAAGETLSSLYAESAKDQQEVTDQLGRQVRRAVEMLVQAFDQIDAESNRSLLASVPEKEVYDAALTVMMRLVFLFSAEERGLLLLGQEMFDQHYAVSTLRELLRERADQHGEEVLERRHDAWSRLLATFRAVHGGVQHEAMRLPAYGGSLFDPDRFPFLEGRETDSRWRETPAHPLAVNNRVVLHLLEALQLLRVKVPGGGPAEARRVSFRALDIEQIGHVYEGLLDHTARRANEVTLGLDGKNEPEIPLSKLEALAGIDPNAAEPVPLEPALMAAETYDPNPIPFPTRKVNYGDTPSAPAALIAFLKDETGRSANALESALGYGKPKANGRKQKDSPEGQSKIQNQQSSIDNHSLLLACGQDPRLARRVRPFAGLLRSDDFGRLAVIRPGAVFVTAGTDRRSSGTHYTPKSLTEPIVKHTLDPLVYIGPAEGLPEGEWKLKSPKEILALKVCDLAMGSGAFLVQVCRYLADRLCEAWELAEKDHAGSILITPDGEFSAGSAAERLLPNDPAERVALARRYVADRCLYGVDINPMAVEMAKLSLWLITLQKDRPFTFLDHALKCGDSLLGVTSVKQIENFSLRPGDRQVTFATANLFRYVDEASAKRRALEDLPSNDHTQIETKNRLHAEAEAATAKVKAVADCLIAFELRGLNGKAYEDQRTVEAEKVELLLTRDADSSLVDPLTYQSGLTTFARKLLNGRRPFHWAVEFPEVFINGGFNGFVGNPPFLGGSRTVEVLGDEYASYIVLLHDHLTKKTDLCCHFFRRANHLAKHSGCIGLIGTNTITQGASRRGTMEVICLDRTITYARTGYKWPGEAQIEVVVTVFASSDWLGRRLLNNAPAAEIDTLLTESSRGIPHNLKENDALCFIGVHLGGTSGFIVSEHQASEWIGINVRNKEVVFPFIGGDDIGGNPLDQPTSWIISFGEMSHDAAAAYRDPFLYLEQFVFPERQKKNADKYPRMVREWWKFWHSRTELYKDASIQTHWLVRARVTSYHGWKLIPANWVHTDMVVVVKMHDWSSFSVLQSAIHETWSERYSSSLGAAPRYIPTDCFEAFPRPKRTDLLDEIGKRFHEKRQHWLRAANAGLTLFAKRFHNRGEQSADIARLRALHVEMDQAVAAAYGWSDLDLGHGFQATKQGERFTLSESARREVLDRLLALNHQRHAEELAAGLHEKKSKAKNPTTKRAAKKAKGYEPPPDLFPPAQPDLFG